MNGVICYAMISALFLSCFNVSSEDIKTADQTVVTGFYCGCDVGISRKTTKVMNSDKKYKKSSAGFLSDLFVGYNKQYTKFVIGAEGSVDVRFARNELNINSSNLSARKKYSMGIALKCGATVSDAVNAYVNVGLQLSKYRIKYGSTKKTPFKSALFVGFGLEKNIGDMFVRGEVDRNFNKKVTKIDQNKISMNSYTMKLGGGYRF